MKLLLLLLSIFSLAACAPATPPEEATVGTSSSSLVEEDDGAMMEDDEDEGGLMEEEEEMEDDDDAGEAEDEKRVIAVTTANWSFSPASITAKKGEHVEIKLTGTEGVHGFAIPGLGINVTVNAGETVSVILPTLTEGTFEFFCSIPCGEGHKDMRGTLTITP